MKKMYAKHNQSASDSNFDPDNENELLSYGLNQAKQVHILASTNISLSKDDIESSKNDLKRYNLEATLKLLQK